MSGTEYWKKETRLCKRCNAPYTPSGIHQKYCSKECANEVANDRARKRYRKKITGYIPKGETLDQLIHESNELGISYGKLQAMKYMQMGNGL